MTNEQLLQQAKDQIKPFQDEAVRRLGYGQSYFEFWVSSKSANNVEEVNSVAALLAIQSAREEGKSEGYHEGYQDAYNQYPHKYLESSEPPTTYSDDLPY